MTLFYILYCLNYREWNHTIYFLVCNFLLNGIWAPINNRTILIRKCMEKFDGNEFKLMLKDIYIDLFMVWSNFLFAAVEH